MYCRTGSRIVFVEVVAVTIAHIVQGPKLSRDIALDLSIASRSESARLRARSRYCSVGGVSDCIEVPIKGTELFDSTILLHNQVIQRGIPIA